MWQPGVVEPPHVALLQPSKLAAASIATVISSGPASAWLSRQSHVCCFFVVGIIVSLCCCVLCLQCVRLSLQSLLLVPLLCLACLLLSFAVAMLVRVLGVVALCVWCCWPLRLSCYCLAVSRAFCFVIAAYRLLIAVGCRAHVCFFVVCSCRCHCIDCYVLSPPFVVFL